MAELGILLTVPQEGTSVAGLLAGLLAGLFSLSWVLCHEWGAVGSEECFVGQWIKEDAALFVAQWGQTAVGLSAVYWVEQQWLQGQTDIAISSASRCQPTMAVILVEEGVETAAGVPLGPAEGGKRLEVAVNDCQAEHLMTALQESMAGHLENLQSLVYQISVHSRHLALQCCEGECTSLLCSVAHHRARSLHESILSGEAVSMEYCQSAHVQGAYLLSR